MGVFCGEGVVVPSRDRAFMLAELQVGHSGVLRLKALAKGVIWWSGLDGMLEVVVKVVWKVSMHNHYQHQHRCNRGVGQPDLGLGCKLILQAKRLTNSSTTCCDFPTILVPVKAEADQLRELMVKGLCYHYKESENGI